MQQMTRDDLNNKFPSIGEFVTVMESMGATVTIDDFYADDKVSTITITVSTADSDLQESLIKAFSELSEDFPGVTVRVTRKD